VFLIDKAGKVAWAKVYAIPDQPPIADLMSVVQGL
jgi:hypothetical protein